MSHLFFEVAGERVFWRSIVKLQDIHFIIEKHFWKCWNHDFFSPGSFFPLWPWLVLATWSDPQISGKNGSKRQRILMGGVIYHHVFQIACTLKKKGCIEVYIIHIENFICKLMILIIAIVFVP